MSPNARSNADEPNMPKRICDRFKAQDNEKKTKTKKTCKGCQDL